MLFMGKHSLKNRTVLLLTHEFNTVIEAIYNMPYNFKPAPKAAFLTTKRGILQEKEITKQDIKSFGEIAWINMTSNIFHKREKLEYRYLDGTPNRQMPEDEIEKATEEIKTKYIADFVYDTEYKHRMSKY